ncbi:hypothetical protein E4K66_06830 [Bradyrhizobium frederickii]|uniref:Uncharacterized protein n=1 Tax=Bradyrhizobium frederickii TaxID=2560054 RepID=A0A4Y9LAK7_9BRAD|nr:hypothetical protein [Bradyrhizobium frederickii]TFV40568.1 hypothetical protein E4K66_06830 [Bradyrhizobium frederickii]
MTRLARVVTISVLLGIVAMFIWTALHYVVGRRSDLLVCQGEHEEECKHHTDFVDCNGDITAIAKKSCRHFVTMAAPEYEAKGGKCGYRTTRVICKR